MNAAAARLLQYEDFETFSKINPNLNHYKCQVHEAFWTQENQELLKFTIRANRFVRGMVRLIVASLVRVGNGRISPEEFEARLAARDRQQAADAAPPDGLYLAHIQYPADTLYPLSGLEAQTNPP
jgi:tRNA pseudouridine38-40 synthase